MASDHVASRESICCHICGSEGLELLELYQHLSRVTSDCKPWCAGGRLGVCGRCGCVQNVIDEHWRSEAAAIYDDYTIYHLSSGAEQVVFVEGSDVVASRSTRLLEGLGENVNLPVSGRLLDIGCGNGGMLRAFGASAPGWSMIGSEVSATYQPEIEAIPGVERLHVGGVESLRGVFDLVTLVHVIEHIAFPRTLLGAIREKLAPEGALLVQLPDLARNPFDLTVADHCSHFTYSTLEALLIESGFEVVAASDEWIPKELSFLVKPASEPAPPREPDPACQTAIAESALLWLRSLALFAHELTEDGDIGLFGTAIAATWLFGELEGRVSFFVDEDPSRIGRMYMGRPVRHPDDVPPGEPVLLALAPALAERLHTRLARSHDLSAWHLPPLLAGLGQAAVERVGPRSAPSRGR